MLPLILYRFIPDIFLVYVCIILVQVKFLKLNFVVQDKIKKSIFNFAIFFSIIPFIGQFVEIIHLILFYFELKKYNTKSNILDRKIFRHLKSYTLISILSILSFILVVYLFLTSIPLMWSDGPMALPKGDPNITYIFIFVDSIIILLRMYFCVQYWRSLTSINKLIN